VIVPMKKVFVIAQEKDSFETARALRALGAVHIEHQRPPQGRDITELEEDADFAGKAVDILSRDELLRAGRRQTGEYIKDWKRLTRHIVDLWKRYDQIKEYNRQLDARIEEWKDWGDFDPAVVGELVRKGVHIRFYLVPSSSLTSMPRGAVVKRIFSRSGMVGCVLVSREDEHPPFKELKMPEASLAELRKRYNEGKTVLGSITEELLELSAYRESFARIKASLAREMEFHRAIRGMGASRGLVYLSGYIPADARDGLVNAARRQKWAVSVKDPEPGDKVPTLIRNPGWVSIIQPVLRILDLVPGYKEYDISLWFLLFFSVFFGMLIGDAGYGAVFLALTFFTSKKVGKAKEARPFFILLYILSGCAVAWGVLTGTFFGQAWLTGSFKPMAPVLRDNYSLQTFCFFLGALHLSIAHIWRSFLKMPSLKASADLGWAAILWGAFFLARTLILSAPFPDFAKYLFLGGAILVIFFTEPLPNVIKGAGRGAGSLLLNIVNSFTDVVSYIRLFAVGLAAVAIADAFNAMAANVGFGSIASGLAAAFILFLGHALNIMLGPLSILVHGVRLNVLEFSSHLDMGWTGLRYRPFK